MLSRSAYIVDLISSIDMGRVDTVDFPEVKCLGGMETVMKRVRIPNEDVQLSDAEIAVTQTRQFQRLFNLKQLGLAYLVYPAASHTRGHHSIRCLHEAQRIMTAISSNDKIEISESDNADVRMTALLHDIGHIAFSHTLEDEHKVLEKHDRKERLDIALDLLKQELNEDDAALVERAKPILLAIASKNESDKDWRSDVVGNTVCADLLAYITTDAEMTGIEKKPGHYRIYEYFTVKDNRLCIKLTKGGLRTDIVSAIMDLLDMRYALTERVIFHHAKCVASAMLARAARLCNLREMSEAKLLQMGDERFLFSLETVARRRDTPEGDGAHHLLNCLGRRSIYQRIFKVGRESRDNWDRSRTHKFCQKWRTPEQVERLLCETEDINRIPRGSLVLWCPDGDGGMKLVQAHVVWDSADESNQICGPVELRHEDQLPYPGVSKRIKMIEDQYLDLWTFWIAIDREYISSAAAVVETLEDKLDIICDTAFKKTYLHQIPNFREDTQNRRLITTTFKQKVLPSTSDRLMGQAALDGSTQPDETTILSAIGEVTDEQTKPSSRRANKVKQASFNREKSSGADSSLDESESDIEA